MKQRYAIMAQTLTQIANAIRSKAGDTEQIAAGKFAEKISEIPSYITVRSEADLPASAPEGTIAIVDGN